MISSRQAADLRAKSVVAEVRNKVHVQIHSGRSSPEMTLRNSLSAGVTEMRRRLIDVYAQLEGASEPPLRDELVMVINDELVSMIRSTVAGVRGSGAAGAARLAANLSATAGMGLAQALDLAAYDAAQLKASASPPPAAPPQRLKHDKLQILDSPSLYAADFKQSVGHLGVSVIYFDLDNFKSINTRFSEPVIDRTLLTSLNQLVAALAAGRGIAYAEGGDEFIVLLPNTSLRIAEAFVLDLLDVIRAATFDVDGTTVQVTASAGLAWSTNPEDAQLCREVAARAKQDAKTTGRDRYVVGSQPEPGEANAIV